MRKLRVLVAAHRVIEASPDPRVGIRETVKAQQSPIVLQCFRDCTRRRVGRVGRSRIQEEANPLYVAQFEKRQQAHAPCLGLASAVDEDGCEARTCADGVDPLQPIACVRIVVIFASI